jgi:hypothetical protein
MYVPKLVNSAIQMTTAGPHTMRCVPLSMESILRTVNDAEARADDSKGQSSCEQPP